jgi:glycosyltransferase involved in cell wall biosynthesis
MIFVGRIHPIKNLDYILSILQHTRANTRLTIVGSIEDKAYWQKCEGLIRALPAHISINWLGERPNHELPAIIAQQHIFVLPTKGENFGHAIFEALVLGKPVLISDQTPWRNLPQAKAGWDISLDEPDLFGEAIEQAAALNQEQYNELVQETFNFAKRHIEETNIPGKYKTLFS